MLKRFENIELYLRALTIPLVIMIIWSIIAFAVGIAGVLKVEVAGSPLVGTGLGVLGSLLGVLMAILTGYTASKQDFLGIKKFIVIGALFGLITGVINGFLSLVMWLFGFVTKTQVVSGLQGISINILLTLFNVQTGDLVGFFVVILDALLVIVLSIISGALFAALGGFVTQKFLR